MHQTMLQMLAELPLFLLTAVATHFVMSFGQTLMHYKLGHHAMGGKFFRNHVNFHHVFYSKDYLVSPTYLGNEGNNTPFFFIPVFLVGACMYLVLHNQSLRGCGNGMCSVVLRARLFRQGIPRRRIPVSAVCMVQTQAGTALRSSPARGLQFRGDRFLL